MYSYLDGNIKLEKSNKFNELFLGQIVYYGIENFQKYNKL